MKGLDAIEKEALEAIVEYSTYIIPAVHDVVTELLVEKKDDTDKLLSYVIKGINWEIEVFNQMEVTINKKATWIDKETVKEAVINLGKRIQEKDYEQVARCLEDDFVPFLKSLKRAAEFRLEQEKD